MKLLACAALLAMAQMVIGVPTTPPACKNFKDFTDVFDERGPVLVPVLADVGTNEKKGLKYTAWRYTTPIGAALLRLRTPSGINTIATGVLTQATSGQPMIEPIDAKVKSIDLKSLRFACVDNTQVAVPVPQTCTILVSAVQKSGKFVSKTLIFNPKLPTQVSDFGSQDFTINNDFKDLIKVNFGLLQQTVPEALSAIVLDNVSYRAYYC